MYMFHKVHNTRTVTYIKAIHLNSTQLVFTHSYLHMMAHVNVQDFGTFRVVVPSLTAVPSSMSSSLKPPYHPITTDSWGIYLEEWSQVLQTLNVDLSGKHVTRE